MEGLLRSLWAVLGGIFRSCPLTSQKLPLCGNQQTEHISGQLLRGLLQNLRNFSEVAPEVRPTVHMAPLCLNHASVLATNFGSPSPRLRKQLHLETFMAFTETYEHWQFYASKDWDSPDPRQGPESPFPGKEGFGPLSGVRGNPKARRKQKAPLLSEPLESEMHACKTR